jgi:hypothetical protein
MLSFAKQRLRYNNLGETSTLPLEIDRSSLIARWRNLPSSSLNRGMGVRVRQELAASSSSIATQLQQLSDEELDPMIEIFRRWRAAGKDGTSYRSCRRIADDSLSEVRI